MSSIRQQYEQYGPRAYYTRFGDQYHNPHEGAIREALGTALATWKPDLSCVLDLACGSGEVTLALRELGCRWVRGIDPFTAAAYAKRVGNRAERFTFENISAGALADRHYSLIVCSFALHLVESSRLPLLAYQLSLISPALLVLTPHKRPQLRPSWGWSLEEEIVVQRVRVRLYGRARPTVE